jgi:hypothetical protein
MQIISRYNIPYETSNRSCRNINDFIPGGRTNDVVVYAMPRRIDFLEKCFSWILEKATKGKNKIEK